MRFYFEYGSFLNVSGKSPAPFSSLMVKDLGPFKCRMKQDSSTGSLASDETGVPVSPTTEEWWPSQTLAAQLWNLWDNINDWNGSPKFDIPELAIESLVETAAILRKDTCIAKTILHLIEDLDCNKFMDVIELCNGNINGIDCGEYCNACQFRGKICTVHGNPSIMFLKYVACAAVRKHVDKLPNNLMILTEMLQENPTYHNTSLLKLVTRFRCYVSYTFNLPGVNLALEESELQDPVIKAWVALIDNSTEILTFEYPHPMVEAVKQYILCTTNRHVNFEKLLSIRKSHPKNFTYANLLLKALKGSATNEILSTDELEELVNDCYCCDQKNPFILSLLGDIAKTTHHNYWQAARYYEKSIKLGGGQEVLQQLDLLPQSDERVKELNIKSHLLLLKDVRDSEKSKMLVRLAILQADKPKTAKDHLQAALKMSPNDPLILELLAEKYLALGRYTSAYKAYHRANCLEPNSHRLNSLGFILLKLGRPADALLQFEEVLEMDKCCGPSLLGCVKALFRLTEEFMYNSVRYPRAVEYANQCVEYLNQVVRAEPLWSAPWKYLGDICLILVQFRDSNIVIPNSLKNALEIEESEESDICLVNVAIKSYNKGLALSPGCSDYLLDLTRAYLELSRSQEEYTLHALTLAKRTVSLRPKDHVAWNLLGAVCIKQKMYNLAQHAHVKSLMLNKTENPAAWTNLGLLYLLNNELELANKCFSRAQSNDPKFAQCWVAMGYLARQMGYKGESWKIFKDLVKDRERIATVEGTLEYGTRFWEAVMSSEMVHEVLTLTTRCSFIKHPAEWLLFNLSGLLSEKLGLHKQALQHFVKAKTLSPSDEIRGGLQRNIDRVQYKLGNYTALNLPQSLWAALSYMKKEQYGMASSTLDTITSNSPPVELLEDINIFQAVLCWASRDFKSIPSFIENTTSHEAKLLKCLLLSEKPCDDLCDAINKENISLQGMLTCLSLKLHESSGDTSVLPLDIDLMLEKNSLSKESMYIIAKYLVAKKVGLGKAKKILCQLLDEAFLKEDIYEMLVEVLKTCPDDVDSERVEEVDNESMEPCDGGEKDSQEEGGTRQIITTPELIRIYSLKSYHMFPWRENSVNLLRSL